MHTAHAVLAVFIVFAAFSLTFSTTRAQTAPRVAITPSPAAGTFLTDSTFDVSILLDTGGEMINAVSLEIHFPPDKLQVVDPVAGQSFITLWIEQPTYSNTEGTIRFMGGVPEGTKTSSGVIATITFRAIKAGRAIVEILPASQILAHDGKGTNILNEVGTGAYQINPRPPEGPRVFSQTHPLQAQWYSNNSPVVSWEVEEGSTDFSYLLDQFPQTTPDNSPETKNTTTSFEDLPDGLWYFHIKSRKEGVWGGSTHFLTRIDTTPSAAFQPVVEILTAAIRTKTIVSFFTTDALSGVDHYEVAVLDKKEEIAESPVFVEAQSPYPVPQGGFGAESKNVRIIVRAVDKAGNVREGAADTILAPIIGLSVKFKDEIPLLVLVLLVLLTVIIFFRHLFGEHRIGGRLKRIMMILRGK